MSRIDNKVTWCISKAKRELEGGSLHRGLVKKDPDIDFARSHILKAEHNLRAITDFKNMGYSDWAASASFYAIYHSLLAVLANFGYESRN